MRKRKRSVREEKEQFAVEDNIKDRMMTFEHNFVPFSCASLATYSAYYFAPLFVTLEREGEPRK